MELVEILARELKEWPATAACYAQDEVSRSIFPYTSTRITMSYGEWDGDYLDHSSSAPAVYNQELALDHATAIVTREMWEQEQAKKSEWNGDGLPPVGTICNVLNRYIDNSEVEKCEILFMGEYRCVYSSESCKERVANITNSRMIAFTPIKTHEQIAAEERDAAIHEMAINIGLNTDPKCAATVLYDKGYRKVGDSK